MSSASRTIGSTILSCLWLAFPSSATAATPVGKVLKKVQEDAQRRDKKEEPPAKPAAEPAPKRPVKVTISKETTYITSPLRPDGYPDYVAALDAIAARGVTPENNAVVLLVQAFGPKSIREEYRERYFEKLGMRPLPKEGQFFVHYDAYTNQLRRRAERDALPTQDYKEAFSQYERALEQPWSEKDCPLVAEWLKANEKPLKLIVEALQRPRYYDPMPVDSEVSLIRIGYGSDITNIREIARILKLRAMRLLQQGKAVDAWRELSAAHHVAALVAQSPTLVDSLVANAIRRLVFSAQRSALHFGSFTPAQLHSMRAALHELSALPAIADRLSVWDRFMCLDAACTAARKGYTSWNFVNERATYTERPVDALRNWVVSDRIDWNEVLRRINAFYDGVSAAGRKPIFRERSTPLAELNKESDLLFKTKIDSHRSWLSEIIKADPFRFHNSEETAALLVAMLSPSTTILLISEYQTPTQMQLTDVALTLALYRAERGAYPDRLEQLVPKYLAEVPKDCYSDAAIRYKREGTGYLLYSLGPNGKDDGGRGRFMDPPPGEDEMVDDGADDIGFRMPALTR